MLEREMIAAISTPPGSGGVGMVRISGAEGQIRQLILGILNQQALPPRAASYLPFLDKNGEAIDQGIAIFFPAPHSYTGETVLELQGHGGTVVLQLVLQRCLNLGARLAEPGEFTKRAFLNNKIDLYQAEAIADLINATTIQAARCAQRSMQGALSQIVNALVSDLIKVRVWVEAHIDFPEEEIGDIGANWVKEQLGTVLRALESAQLQSKQGVLLREGANIVLLGRPNVGKSSLLNQLAGNDVAIVSDVPGTTRDTVQQHLQINGVPINVIDTAGLRQTNDRVETIGIERAQKVAQQANVILWLSDTLAPDFDDPEISKNIPKNTPVICVLNKADLVDPSQLTIPTNKKITAISAKTGDGIQALREEILKQIGWQEGEGVYIARERHLQQIEKTKYHLEVAMQSSMKEPEVLAEELRLAQNELNKITGEFSSDDLLGKIFTQFCIGK